MSWYPPGWWLNVLVVVATLYFMKETKPMYSHPGAVPGKANGVWESVLNGPTQPVTRREQT